MSLSIKTFIDRKMATRKIDCWRIFFVLFIRPLHVTSYLSCAKKKQKWRIWFSFFFFAVYIDRPTWLDAVVAEMGRFVVFSLGCFFLRFSLLRHLIRHALIRIIWIHQILLELLFEGFEDFKFSQRVSYCKSANALNFHRMSYVFIRIDCSLNALSKIFWVRFDKIKRWPAKCSTSSMRR